MVTYWPHAWSHTWTMLALQLLLCKRRDNRPASDLQHFTNGPAMTSSAPSARTTLHRLPQRGHHDRATIEAIVDQALLCHIAFTHDGDTHCLPTTCWRSGEHLYLHAANNSRMALALLAADSCVCITHLDGLVLARSAFHHSMNYRSVVIYGRFAEVVEPEAKRAALTALIEHISPGRSTQVRAPNRAELSGTRVVRIALSEAAAKIRDWGALDDPEDMTIPVWAGVLPLALRAGTAQPAAECQAATPPAFPPCVVG